MLLKTPCRSLSAVLAAVAVLSLNAQIDTTRARELRAAEVVGPYRSGVRVMHDTLDAVIMAGKKTTVITPAALDADLAQNQARQVFAKVPGISVWESEGSGIQLSVAARGLSPNRSWEFNMRQNGYDIASDPFGYPEAYYTPPMEAVERIEVVRGAASLAYGPQFGGLVNMVLKKGVPDRALAFETRQTAGSYGLFDSYNGLGGTKGKWSYYGYLHHRSADGWRDNSRYTTTNVHGNLSYAATPRLRLGLEYTRSTMQQQQPGGLTDAQFVIDPQSSSRERNWLVIPWNVGAATLSWRPDARTLVDAKVFGVIADRGSVGFTKAITEPDIINGATNAYAARQVDKDHYANLGAELRVRRSWTAFGREAVLSTGIRGYGADNHRQQQGVGTSGSDADLSVSGAYGRELDLGTRNAAFWAENLFRLTDKLSVVPGVRLEHLTSTVNGRINTSGTGNVDSGERTRFVPLFGLGAQLQATTGTQVYANFSQAYRPVLYSDLTPSATTDVIDPDLRDAHGYNLDAGYRGTLSEALSFDISGFRLFYDDRIGTVLKDGVNYRTNIGTSVSTGVEAYAESDLLRVLRGHANGTHLSVFASYAFVDARYTRWNNPAIAEDPTKSIADKRVENAPRNILRGGITYRDKHISMSVQGSMVDGVYTDAANTEAPNATATVGWIAGYTVIDANVTWTVSEHISLSAAVNNVFDEAYATRRSGGYPGPGLLPGMGRNGLFTLAAKF
ncbi:MAG: TonB-dependent receptor [Flavobacteriales bacterium]|nr:TonB-dependent receptor [Flavobacteriales bacterium]